jgi:hypothetical protein
VTPPLSRGWGRRVGVLVLSRGGPGGQVCGGRRGGGRARGRWRSLSAVATVYCCQSHPHMHSHKHTTHAVQSRSRGPWRGALQAAEVRGERAENCDPHAHTTAASDIRGLEVVPAEGRGVSRAHTSERETETETATPGRQETARARAEMEAWSDDPSRGVREQTRERAGRRGAAAAGRGSAGAQRAEKEQTNGLSAHTRGRGDKEKTTTHRHKHNRPHV